MEWCGGVCNVVRSKAVRTDVRRVKSRRGGGRGGGGREDGRREGGAAAAAGRRIGFLIPFSLSQKKSPRNGEVVKRDFAAAATEVDILGLAGREGIHSIISIKTEAPLESDRKNLPPLPSDLAFLALLTTSLSS